MARPPHPDVLVVVLDCVRARDFFGGEDSPSGLKTAKSLAAEGELYDRAVAPASWTLPSHASMFTGLYPWEDGVYGPHINGVPLSTRTLAQSLRALDFQTVSFSANPYISPEFGVVKGFDTNYWGTFADCYLRKITRWTSSPQVSHPGNGGARVATRESIPSRRWRGTAIARFPIVADVVTRLISRTLTAGAGSSSLVAPWIESSVENWLATASREKPVFCYVNLLDAHEPFIGLPERIDDFADWMRAHLVPQVDEGREGEGRPLSVGDAQRLRGLYREAIRILDSRLAELFRIFQAARNWDNTCVVVTSDHGQALGEENLIFHNRGVPDGIHRVPLVVKPIHGRGGRRLNHDWTTLSDLPSIIATASFGTDSSLGGTVRVPRNGQADNRTPLALSLAYSGESEVSDGNYPRGSRGAGGPAVVGYAEEYKVVIDAITLKGTAFRIVSEGGSRLDPTSITEMPSSGLITAAMKAANRIRESMSDPGFGDIPSRLKRWGYE